jgi:hypothetical protein
MLLALLLCGLTAPHASVAPAGFLRDTRVELGADGRLAFEARMQWPATITRRSFVVEGLGPDGTLLFERAVRAQTSPTAARRRQTLEAHFELELPPLDGVRELRVRCAR